VNWLGDLVRTYNTSLTLAYNFAAGGATVDPSLVKPSITTKSLIEQLSQFSSSVASKPSYAPWTSDNSLFTVWIGINDVGNSDRSSSGEAALLGKVVQQYTAQVQKMYDAGGRHFVFLTVPRSFTSYLP
jgi:phospholipase/lecithinase/hemolysin